MKRYEDMTYDEQRALLGLWHPTFSFHWERLGRGLGEVFQSIATVLRDNMEDVQTAFTLAGEK